MSFGKDEGDTYGENSDLNDPNFTFRPGIRDRDIPVSIKVSGLYELPYGIRFSGSIQHYMGFPEPTVVTVGADTVALTRVTQSVRVDPFGTVRLPSVDQADISVRRSFVVSGGRKIEPVIDLYNIGNTCTVLVRTTQLGPTYGRAGNVLNGRTLKVGLNVAF